MNAAEPDEYVIKCQCCSRFIREEPSLGRRWRDTLQAICEMRATEAGWRDGWVCPYCCRAAHRFRVLSRGALNGAMSLLLALLTMVILMGAVKIIKDGEAEEWNTIVETRVAQMPPEHKKALRWLAVNWTVSGDEWRREHPHADACLLHDHTGVMECQIRADRWIIRRDCRKAVLRATKGFD